MYISAERERARAFNAFTCERDTRRARGGGVRPTSRRASAQCDVPVKLTLARISMTTARLKKKRKKKVEGRESPRALGLMFTAPSLSWFARADMAESMASFSVIFSLGGGGRPLARWWTSFIGAWVFFEDYILGCRVLGMINCCCSCGYER